MSKQPPKQPPFDFPKEPLPVFLKEQKITPTIARQLRDDTVRAEEAGLEITKADGTVITFHQRTRNRKQQNILQSALQNDVWRKDTGETIKVSEVTLDGELVQIVPDGQHRLGAVMESGVAMVTSVALVPLDVFPYLDQHLHRDAKQIMATEGWRYPGPSATIAKAWFAEETTGDPMGSTVFGDSEIVDTFRPFRDSLLYPVLDAFFEDTKHAVANNGLLHQPGALYALTRIFEAEVISLEDLKVITGYLRNPVLNPAPSSLWANYASAMQKLVFDFASRANHADLKFNTSLRALQVYSFRQAFNFHVSKKRAPAARRWAESILRMTVAEYDPLAATVQRQIAARLRKPPGTRTTPKK